MRYYTPLRYPGGKSKLFWLIEEIILANNFEGGEYIEPYAGGAGIAMELLLKGIVSRIQINDLNVGVYSFWHCLLNETENLMGRIYDCSLNMDTWYLQREVMKNAREHSVEDIGFAFFYLNRTNRSGIINAGVIGGYEQKGNYKIDARFNKDELINRITAIAKRRESISLHNLDAESFLATLDVKTTLKKFAYIDPPYYMKGKRLYDNFYADLDHGRIAKLLEKLQTPWILSYDDHPRIREIYTKFRMSELSLSYSAATKSIGQEVIYFSDTITVPPGLEAA